MKIWDFGKRSPHLQYETYFLLQLGLIQKTPPENHTLNSNYHPMKRLMQVFVIDYYLVIDLIYQSVV